MPEESLPVVAAKEPEVVYGRLLEGVHIAGYSFERACGYLEWLLEGERWQQGGRFTEVNAFMESLRLGQFKQATDQRKRIVARIKALQPKVSNAQIARTLGTSDETINRDVRATNVAPTAKKDSQLNEGNKPGATNVARGPSGISGEAAAKIVERRTGGTERTQQQRAEKERVLGAKIAALPDKKYGVILADPEWHDDVWSEETGMDRHASRHYPTSDIDAIIARPVATIAAPDCVLFLWSTNQHLNDALDVLDAWGFRYASHYIWLKPSLGRGYWNRSVHEVLLIGTCGKPPAPALGTQQRSVIDAPRGPKGHSSKPEVFLEMIETYYPTMPKIELNRRGPPRPGWDAWGNEAEAAE